ncbi:hypothetical protein HNR06_000989 [Nocardiopsis arvandica]|uniref:Uncharacterized protein n=1 Tax=Nocardiopsis sinuspersici TaxID=501010 RepID=A0A7Y9XAT7_9ACTN|nr:hypothetical protein [Nocardiopsis sinuspersici]NYH51400.1 hypothetical protein [Nocardiopsis sinuspersici]
MNQPPRTAPNEVQVMLAIVCESAPDVRDRLSHRPPGPALVDRVLDAARTGQDPAPALRLLHTALTASGVVHGLYSFSAEPVLPPELRGLNAAGIGRARPAPADYRCPRHRCTRAWQPSPADAVPTCHIDGTRLTPGQGA